MKKLLSICLFLLLFMMSWADSSGICGKNMLWTYDESSKTLTISGTGDMSDFGSFYPWSPFDAKIKKIVIDEGVVSIGPYAFCSFDSLSSVTIPSSIKRIGEGAFYSCNYLTSVNISNIAAWCNIDFKDFASNPLYLAFHIYLNGEEIRELVIPDGVTKIGNSAFAFCDGLTSVSIPNSVTSIGIASFADCYSLTSVSIPNSVTNIGQFAFVFCDSLECVKVYGDIPPSAYDDSFSNYEINLCVPEKSIERYKTTYPWNKFTNIVGLESTDIESVKMLPYTVSISDGTITVIGAQNGVVVEAYNAFGFKLGAATSVMGCATINTNMRSNDFVIVKVGSKTIKIKY